MIDTLKISKFENPLRQKINVWLNYALIAFAFVLPISRSGISILIVVIPLLWIAEGGWKTKWEVLKKDRFVLAICAYLGFVLLSLLWTDNYSKAVLGIKNYGHLILIPIVMLSVEKHNLIKLFRAFAIGMVILIFLCVLNYFKIWTKPGKVAGAANLFMHRLDFSMFLATTIIMGLVFIQNHIQFVQKKKWNFDTILWIFLISISLIWMFVQDGRSGQLALAVSLPVFVIRIFWKKNKLTLGVLIILFSGFIYSQFHWNSSFRGRVLDAKNEMADAQKAGKYESSVGYRLIAWKISLKLISERPVAGYGIGDSMDVVQATVDNWKDEKIHLPPMDVITKNHVHNQYLQILLETGAIGLVLFLTIFCFFYQGSLDRTASLMLVIIFFTGFIAEPFMRNQFTSALISFFMAWIYSFKTSGDE